MGDPKPSHGPLQESGVGVKNVAVIGFGNVGSGIISALVERRSHLLALRKVVVKHIDKERRVALPKGMVTDKVDDVLGDPQVDIVVEVTGAPGLAYDIAMRALRNGKHVVTANKALMVQYGAELFREAKKSDRQIGYRGTFVGCYTLLHHLSDMLQGGLIRKVNAILNGTCNYILSTMEATNCTFEQALAGAQERGYAEPDPTEDIEGTDTQRKIKILLGLTSNTSNIPDLPCEGITGVTLPDIVYARELGYRIRLLGSIEHLNERTYAHVFPALVPLGSVLGETKGVNNAIEIEDVFGVVSGLVAPGAGEKPTAAALLRDLEDIAKGVQVPMPGTDVKLELSDPAGLEWKFYLRLAAVDSPGVLAQISEVFGKMGISIAAVMQKEAGGDAGVVPVVMVLHRAVEQKVDHAIQQIKRLSPERTRLVQKLRICG